MSLLPILIYGDPCLSAVAAPVGEITVDIRALAADMCETMYDAPGRGLAAPQVGVGKRLFVMDCTWKDGTDWMPRVIVDPEITWRSDSVASGEEGCLSIPGLPMTVERATELDLTWTDLEGQRNRQRFTGMEAICIQHEYDHLDGVLITDRAAASDRAALDDQLRALEAQVGTV